MLNNSQSLITGPKMAMQPKYFFTDDFETASPKDGWFYQSVSNNTVSPLSGTRSWRINSTNSVANLWFPPQDEVWFFCKFYLVGSWLFQLHPQSGTPNSNAAGAVFAVAQWNGTQLRVVTGGFDEFPVANISGSVSYCWAQYKRGSGSNAICRLWVSSTTTRPATPLYTRTNANSMVPAVRWWTSAGGANLNNQMDNFRLSSTEIGNDPL